ncbi:MAG: hypothetical protein HRT72_02130 [Flavobacteriales bacterium]|nr:hypothetical protein [Flavobacteriales bacterium]
MLKIDAKTSLIVSLIKMAQVSGEVSHPAQMNISILSDEMKVDGGLVATLKQNLSAVSVVVPKSAEGRIEYFWRVLTMMKMDMQISEGGIALGKEIGSELQFSYHELESIVSYMVENSNKFIRLDMFRDEMVEINKRPKLRPPKTGLMKLLFGWLD